MTLENFVIGCVVGEVVVTVCAVAYGFFRGWCEMREFKRFLASLDKRRRS